MHNTKRVFDNVAKSSSVVIALLLSFVFLLIYVSFYGVPSQGGASFTQKLVNTNEGLLKQLKTQQKLLLKLQASMVTITNGIERKMGTKKDSLADIQQQITDMMKKMDKTMLTVAQKVISVDKKEDKINTPSSKKSDEAKRVVVTEEDENYRHIRTKELESLQLDFEEVQPLRKPAANDMHDKWIVVTSIFKPTDDLRILAGIPGWRMVVVGDKKTPKDWKLDNTVFLSIEDQKNLGFETVKYLKYGVYQRKNMGFLYAIHHGAKYIYDTDDDNHPYGEKVAFDVETDNKSYLMYHSDRHHYNTFEHFGQSTLWPRGYPLDMIDQRPVRTYKRCKKVRALVQQGVVDGDPDLDAIQRLTRKDADVKFVVYFDIKAKPVVLPPRSFAPYNTQNTFHHYDAFFSLMLPQTVTFRVNDIWRGYITQRLLWDIGGHLAYYPPNAYQDRTPHNFLKDFYEEDDLYKNTNPLTQFLLKFNSTKTNMLERHFEIIKGLYKLDILGALDVHLAKAWARDMKRIGYKPPPMQKATAECEENIIRFQPEEMPTLFNRIGQKTVNVVKIADTLPLTKERVRDAELNAKHDSKSVNARSTSIQKPDSQSVKKTTI